jgi:hypothetical protein
VDQRGIGPFGARVQIAVPVILRPRVHLAIDLLPIPDRVGHELLGFFLLGALRCFVRIHMG